MDEHSDTTPLKQLAQELGFTRLGVAAAGRSPNADAFLRWLDRGQHAGMEYMARQVARRLDPRETVAGARSVVVVTLPYDDLRGHDQSLQHDESGNDESDPPTTHSPTTHTPNTNPSPEPARGKIARYARGRDYHKVMPPLLKKLATWIAADGRY